MPDKSSDVCSLSPGVEDMGCAGGNTEQAADNGDWAVDGSSSVSKTSAVDSCCTWKQQSVITLFSKYSRTYPVNNLRWQMSVLSQSNVSSMLELTLD